MVATLLQCTLNINGASQVLKDMSGGIDNTSLSLQNVPVYVTRNMAVSIATSLVMARVGSIELTDAFVSFDDSWVSTSDDIWAGHLPAFLSVIRDISSDINTELSIDQTRLSLDSLFTATISAALSLEVSQAEVLKNMVSSVSDCILSISNVEPYVNRNMNSEIEAALSLGRVLSAVTILNGSITPELVINGTFRANIFKIKKKEKR